MILRRVIRFIKRASFLVIFIIFSTVTIHLLMENNPEIKSLISENRMMKILTVNQAKSDPIGNPKISLFIKSITLENILKTNHQPKDGKNIFFIESSHVLPNVSETIGIREACSFESAGRRNIFRFCKLFKFPSISCITQINKSEIKFTSQYFHHIYNIASTSEIEDVKTSARASVISKCQYPHVEIS